MTEKGQNRFANRKTISLSNKELIEAVLADRKIVFGESGKHQIDAILMNEAPPLFSGKYKELEIIVKENYCDDDAVTIMLRRMLHALESQSMHKDFISAITGKLAHIIQKHIPMNEAPLFDVAPGIIAYSTKNHLLMHLGPYVNAITENPYISELVRANLQAAWTCNIRLLATTLSSENMGILIHILLDDMKYPGMVCEQLYFLSALIDCLTFPNTPESRLDIITAIQ